MSLNTILPKMSHDAYKTTHNFTHNMLDFELSISSQEQGLEKRF